MDNMKAADILEGWLDSERYSNEIVKGIYKLSIEALRAKGQAGEMCLKWEDAWGSFNRKLRGLWYLGAANYMERYDPRLTTRPKSESVDLTIGSFGAEWNAWF